MLHASLFATAVGLIWSMTTVLALNRIVATKVTVDSLVISILIFSKEDPELKQLAAVLVVLGTLWTAVMLSTTLRVDTNPDKTDVS